MKVLIVGSLNIDYIAAVKRLPAAGETVAATGLVRRFGGKGANQAVAAARQGARVSMIGCVGADDAGRAYCERLRAEGIDASGVTVTRQGFDRHGANRRGPGGGEHHHRRCCRQWRVEACRYPRAARPHCVGGHSAAPIRMPMPTVIEAVRVANRAQVPVVLNPSPLRDGFPWSKCGLDTLIANAGEAQTIFGAAAGQSSCWPGQMAALARPTAH